MNAGALAREWYPVPTFAKGEMVRELGEVGVGVEALDCGLTSWISSKVRGEEFVVIKLGSPGSSSRG
jgi:hypothetical protein